jgi:hypothetical protein
MVDLNRQIRATQARQGGFSAHVLPAPVGYQPPEIIIFTDGTATRCADSSVEFLDLSTGSTLAEQGLELVEYTAPFGYEPDGGPFGEPCFVTPGAGTAKLSGVRIQGDAIVIGTQDYTLEGWFLTGDLLEGDTRGAALAMFNGTQDIRVVVEANKAGLSGIQDGNIYSIDPPITQVSEVRTTAAGGSVFYIRWRPATNGVWRHWAIARTGATTRVWDHGNEVVDTTPATFNSTPPSSVFNFTPTAVDFASDLKMGQCRLIIGQAIYSGSTITIPTAPFISV